MPCRRRSERPAGSSAEHSTGRDDGAVTVEAALALGTLVAVTAAAVAAVATVATAIRCTDAARELVRQAARGDTDRGRVAAAALAPTGAEIALRFDGDAAVATVAARPVGPLPIRISGSASAVTEPGLAPDGTVGDVPGPRAGPPGPGTPGTDLAEAGGTPRAPS